MAIPVLIIPVLNRFDLLDKALASIDHPVDDLLIVDNSGRLRLEMPDVPVERVHVLNMPNNLGVSGSWNLGIKCFPLAPWWMISSNDNAWGPGAMAQMANESGEDRVVFSGTHWDSYTLGSQVVAKVGLFDENLYPAYYEDLDYLARLEYHEITMVETNAPMDQYGHGTTVKSSELIKHHDGRTNPANRALYEAKRETPEDGHRWVWDIERRRAHDWPL